MRTQNLLKSTLLLVVTMLFTLSVNAQTLIDRELQYFRPNDARGLNVFETPKVDTVGFDGVKVRVGGDFAIQFQGISQSNDGDSLVALSNNLTLPTANLNIDVQLMDGVRMHLRTFLSSRHHTESYVKGGYIQMDKLDFIQPGFLSGVMEIATIRVGMDEINYGDAHFRRSDNAKAIHNPFVGNYIMDGFTTEPFIEVTLQPASWVFVAGVTNGRLNQEPTEGDDGFVFYGKAGYDKQVNDDFRFRVTGSIYSSSDNGTRDYLYGGDRAGGRYYNIMHTVGGQGTDFEPRINPGYAYQTAYQINPFIKYDGLEFFGIYEKTKNGNDDLGGDFTQLAAELLYRFGTNDQLYVAGRYNNVKGTATDLSGEQEQNRINVGAGWFMSKNVLAKLEYVKGKYKGDGYEATRFQGAEYDGIVIEAVIGF